MIPIIFNFTLSDLICVINWMIEIINMLIYFKMDSRWMQVFMNGFFMLFTYSLILINREKRVECMFLGFSNLGEIHLLLKPFQR